MDLQNHLPSSVGDIIKTLKSQEIPDLSPPVSLDIETLIDLFNVHFRAIYGKRFIESDETKDNLNALLYYFVHDPRFLEHPNVIGNSSTPDCANKGLLIIGGYGTGKTSYMRALEAAFRTIHLYKFKTYSTNEVVLNFESHTNQGDINQFFESMNRGTILFDDLGAERVASNYGKFELLKEILERRYMRNKLTHITTNYPPGFENDVSAAIEAIGERYGARVYDRLFEMFNIVVFKGKSFRR